MLFKKSKKNERELFENKKPEEKKIYVNILTLHLELYRYNTHTHTYGLNKKKKKNAEELKMHRGKVET